MGISTTTKVYKYGGKLHYEWEASLVEHTETYILLYGKPGRKLIHHSKGKIFEYDTHSIEFYPKNQWFTANIDIHKNGETEYYCNICIPAKFDKGIISFTDLDIDIVRNKTGQWSIVDEDEFEINSKELGYPTEIIVKAKEALSELLLLIKDNRFPFDGFLEKYNQSVVKGELHE